MKDKLIINSISKVYSTIVSFFILIILTLSVTYFILSNGVYLKELSLSSFHINKLYIKWNKKLNIHVDNLTIFTKKDTPSIYFEPKDIRKNLKKFGFLGNFLETLIIEKLHYRDITATIRYLDNKGGYIRASSKNFNIDTIIHKNENYINFEIIDFKDSIKKINAQGNLVLDLQHREMLLDLNLNIEDEISLEIFTYVDSRKLQYAIKSKKNIQNYDYLISILDVNKELKYWIYDAIKMQYVTLNQAYGFIDFRYPDKALDNLYLSADIHKLNYKYHHDLDSIHTESTNIEFTHGILNIRPKKHTTYDFFLDKSWLKINFNKTDPELTLHLLFQGFVDKNLLHILNTFGIKLPFSQNQGKLDTDLTLVINLMNLDVNAVGEFFTKKANFTYLGLDLDIFNSHIILNNFDVTIDKMFAKYKTDISANVTAQLDTKHNEGEINFDVKKATFLDDMFILNQDNPLTVKYEISKNGDMISISKSKWHIFSQENIAVEALKIPFNYENLFATIPTTKITIDNIGTAYSSGSASFKTMSTNLEFDLAKFKYKNINMTQSGILFDLSYADSKLYIKSHDTLKFTIDNLDYFVDKPNIFMHKGTFLANSSKFTIDSFLSSEFVFNYSTVANNGFINLKKLKLFNDEDYSIFEKNKSIYFQLKKENEKYSAYSSDLDIYTSFTDKKWELALNSLHLLHKHSKILQKYHLDKGNLLLSKINTDDNIKILGQIKHKTKFITINDKPISKYFIKGEIDAKTNNISLNINNRLNLKTDINTIDISGHNLGININEVVNFIKELGDNNSTTSETKNINMELKDSNIYFSKDRKAIADKINLQYYNNIATAQLVYKDAHAGFKLQNDVFYLYGEDFNDEFMDNLFALSKFKEGDFDFSIQGSLEEYKGILYIKDTTILDYKVLNNVLAFVNTIPSLMTFSLPGYDKDGLSVESSYLNFSFKNDQYTLQNIYLNSKEIEITGNGVASYKDNSIDVNLNLKTDLASAISKIPVVGYIIFDEDSISTSLNVSGALNNPKVESMIAREIIVAPLNIIKRTLLFPFKIFKSD